MAKTKKKITWSGGSARAYVHSSFNNTIITITDERGNTFVWTSAGSCGFKGTKKGTPYAAQIAASLAAKRAGEMGIKKVSVFVTGPGPGREVAIRGLQAGGLTIAVIRDITPLPHNGCRSPKQRRV